MVQGLSDKSLAEKSLLMRQESASLQSIQYRGWEVSALSRRDPNKASVNEDALLVWPLGPGSFVAAVADGCGGTKLGQAASQIAIAALAENLEQVHQSPQGLRHCILDAMEDANEKILDLGMGAACTLAVMTVADGVARSFHVGDAQALVANSRGRVRYQSICHSPMGYAVASGLMTDRQAMHQDNRHQVSNVLGHRGMRIEVGPSLTLSRQDRILVSSDGLFDNLYLEEIAQRLKPRQTRACARSLYRLAAQRMIGGASGSPSKPDDLTFLVARLQ